MTERRARPARASHGAPWILGIAALALAGGGPVLDQLEAEPAVAAITPLATAAPVRSAAPDVDPAFVEIGNLERSGERDAARGRLEALAAATTDTRAPLARTLLGLLAHAHDDPAQAATELAAVAAPTPLDDWRLYVLADSDAALGHGDAARAALLDLLDRHPDSPLRAASVVRLAELAWQGRDAAETLRRIAQGRAERLDHEQALTLEKLAWEVALAGRDPVALRDSARRLLVLDPLEASRMHLVDAVAARGGSADWRLWLDADELVARAAALLDDDLPAGALATLAAVEPPARGLDWSLLEARALIASGRGAEAWSRLAGVAAGAGARRAELDWQAARAAHRAADGVGRSRPDAAARATWLRLERERLLAVARGEDAAPELRRRALARLAERYLDEDRESEAITALRQLAALAPSDTSGARPLWERGWEKYRGGDVRGATTTWSQVVALYPASSQARSASYWTARAMERLGDGAGARQQYLAVLSAHVFDFYSRQAALRLAGARATTTSTPEAEPWPGDRRLDRARLLSDLGLEGLARAELDALADGAEPRAAAALSSLVYARAGATRDSLREIKRAFPQLGTALQGTAPAEALTLYYPLDYREAIARAAAEQGLSPALVFGMVHQESGFDPGARSRSGARGLMQLMPSTGREVARGLGLPFSYARLSDPNYSLRLGTSYFRRVLEMFDGNTELALAAYNGGPGRISRLWRAEGPDPQLDRFLEELSLEESRNYVKRIVVLAESYRSLYPDLG
jgi:soluble lytic murein transglycosylase-like protein